MRKTCHYCARKFERVTIDHIVPVARGGRNVGWNYVDACQPCNQAKGSDWPTCDCVRCSVAVSRHKGSRELRAGVRYEPIDAGVGGLCGGGHITMSPEACPWCSPVPEVLEGKVA